MWLSGSQTVKGRVELVLKLGSYVLARVELVNVSSDSVLSTVKDFI